MILYIDTTDFNRVMFALFSPLKIRGARGVTKKVYKISPHQSYKILEYLDNFLKSVKIKPSSALRAPSPKGRRGRVEISKIIVCKGPGSFTGVRIGVVMAQALGFAWNVPVKALVKRDFEIILSAGKPKS